MSFPCASRALPSFDSLWQRHGVPKSRWKPFLVSRNVGGFSNKVGVQSKEGDLLFGGKRQRKAVQGPTLDY